MPNWVKNEATFTGTHAQLAPLIEWLNTPTTHGDESGLLSLFRPIPTSLRDSALRFTEDQEIQRQLEAQWAANKAEYGHEFGADWTIANWAPNQDVPRYSVRELNAVETDRMVAIQLAFQSANDPPFILYDYVIEKLGIDVTAHAVVEGRKVVYKPQPLE